MSTNCYQKNKSLSLAKIRLGENKATELSPINKYSVVDHGHLPEICDKWESGIWIQYELWHSLKKNGGIRIFLNLVWMYPMISLV